MNPGSQEYPKVGSAGVLTPVRGVFRRLVNFHPFNT